MPKESAPTMPTKSSQPITIDFRGMFFALRERLLLIAVCCAVGLLGAVTYLIKTPKSYVAQCIVQVDDAKQQVVKIEDVTAENLDKTETLRTIERTLGSRPVVERLVRDPALHLTAETLGLPPRSTPYIESDIAETLMSRIAIELVRGTRLISVTVQNKDAATAANIANGVVREYRNQLLDSRHTASSDAHAFLVQESERLKEKLEKSERALQAYKEKSQSVSLEGSQNIIVEKLKELNARVTEASALRVQMEADAAQVKELHSGKAEDLLTIPRIAEAPEVVEQRKQVADMEATVASLNERYLEKHPKLIQAKSQLAELQTGLDRAIHEAAQRIVSKAQTAEESERQLRDALSEQETKALELNKMAIPYNVLAREVDSDRALYESVLTRLKETDVAESVDPNVIEIVEPALPSDAPARPRKKLVLAGGVVGGLFLGMFLSLALMAVDTSLKTVDQAEGYIGIPVLAAISKLSRKLAPQDTAVVSSDPDSVEAEAFRTLRTALIVADGDARSFLFTSAIANDGKTFCALNTALSFAQLGPRTLLIDADLRLPSLETALFGEAREPGLADVLEGDVSLQTAVRSTKYENLFALTAGTKAARPAELLARPAMERLIREALVNYDRVVVDTAPVQAVSDALLLVKLVHSVCVVVSAGITPRKAVAKACERLAAAGAKGLGVILNRVPKNGHYFYHYGTEYYGEKQEKSDSGELPVKRTSGRNHWAAQILAKLGPLWRALARQR
jgi:capsular exopolysaccharide synthesis family protein